MADIPYSNRELDSKLGEIVHKVKNIQATLGPFETDMRQSLSRVEMDINNIRTHVEDRIRQERAESDNSYSPMLAWRILWGILAVFGVAVAMAVVRAIGL